MINWQQVNMEVDYRRQQYLAEAEAERMRKQAQSGEPEQAESPVIKSRKQRPIFIGFLHA